MYQCTSCGSVYEDRGNFFLCPGCKQMVHKLAEQDGPWEPLPRQSEFINSDAKFCLYVGGVGSGKTMAGSFKAIFKALDHPGGQGLIGAQTVPQLRDATQKTFFEVLPEILVKDGSLKKAWKVSDNILTMRNGHQILFRPLHDESVLRSLNLVWFYIDEASEVEKEIFLQLQARIRSRFGIVNGQSKHQGWLTSNPAGKDWMYEIFVLKNANNPNFMHVVAPTKENFYLPEGYEETLRATYPEAWVKRFLEGSFDAFEGQIYTMLDPAIHANIPYDFFDGPNPKLPEGWPLFVSLDHGFTNPTAIGFYTVTPDDEVIKIDELYEGNRPVSYHADAIKGTVAKWGRTIQDVRDYVIDPSTKGQRGMTGRAVMSEYHDNGIPFRPANNQVHAGIIQVMEYLLINPYTNRPRFFIHERCVNTWEEMGQYRWDKPRTNFDGTFLEQPLEKNDHTCDETRYMIMTRPKVNLLKSADPFTMRMQALTRQIEVYRNLPHALQSERNRVLGSGPSRYKW